MSDTLRGDRVLWIVALLLGVFGLLVVYSATVSLVFRHHPEMPEYYLVKHGLTLIVSFFLAYVVHLTDYRRWGALFEIFWWISVVLLIYVFFRGGGAQRWIYIGGISLQPSELARFTLMGVLAYRMAAAPERLVDWEGLFPLLWRVGLTFGLIAPLNLSNGLLLLSLSGLFLYIGGVPLRFLLRIAGIGILLVGVLFLVAPRAKVWQQRILAYWKGEVVAAPRVDDYQRAHASLAVYSGGIWGKGPGRSTQRYYLPQSYSDFAYSILIEEYGLVGGLLILGLYALFLWRLAALATLATGFAQLLLIGAFLQIAMQVIIHVGVSLELLPITGIPLPWISLGGSSLLVQALLLGLSLAVSSKVLSK
ncbi:MAG: FtsW/RodA/SpoVE family cell cycle protein [Bacteroidia bacterium]|nr:FtsW/RodA/SpoVE family cell cycle protein [Bacteroidia bacterium]